MLAKYVRVPSACNSDENPGDARRAEEQAKALRAQIEAERELKSLREELATATRDSRKAQEELEAARKKNQPFTPSQTQVNTSGKNTGPESAAATPLTPQQSQQNHQGDNIFNVTASGSTTMDALSATAQIVKLLQGDSSLATSILNPCSHAQAAQIGLKLHASPQNREAARKGKFVPLAHFLYASASTAKDKDDEAALDNDTTATATAAAISATLTRLGFESRKKDKDVPRFKSWESVVEAFCGGLVPVACVGRPDRLLDYTMLFAALSVQHASGNQHWPVLLRYIEETRRAKQPSSLETETEKAKAERHRLAPSLAVMGDDSMLETARLAAAGNLWAGQNRNRLLDDFLDPSVLPLAATLTAEAAAATKRQEKPKQHPSAPLNGTPSRAEKAGFRTDQLQQLWAKPEKVCVNFLLGSCKAAQCSRPHLSKDQALMMLTPQ